MRALRDVVRQERPALVHVWDWWQCLDAYYAVHLMMRLPMVVTDMMMDLTRVLPKDLPTTFGTPELVERARAAGRRRVELIMPPVDVTANAPGAVDPQPLREHCRISPHEIVLVTVSRLADFMKAESLLRTIDVVRVLGRELPLRFVIVGDGAGGPKLEALARATNDELGRDAVVLTGALIDPRPAYAMADIVVGMGGSALRGMAFGKPVVIVGERGFARAFTPRTMEYFRYRGMYGVGDGHPGNDGFAANVRELATMPACGSQLGAHARNFVVKEYSLETLSARLDCFCKQAVSHPSRFHTATADGLRTAAVYLRERRFLTPSRDAAPGPTLQR